MIWDKYNGCLSWQFYEPEPTAESFFMSAPSGWWKILDGAFESMFAIGWDGRVYDIKEKYGSLRLDVSSSDDEIDVVCLMAEEDSVRTCQVCGDPGKMTRGHWLYVLCESCKEKENT